MQIHGPAQIHGPQPISSPHRLPAAQPTAPTGQSAAIDQLEISREADMVSRVRDIPDIRADRVAELRAAIESGAYETDDKMDVAVERLLDEFA